MPTKEELLRQAEEKDLLAQRYETYARSVGPYFDKVSTAPEGTQIWTGPAADRFMGDVRTLSAKVKELQAGFQQTAKRLRATAEDLREQARNAD